MANELLPYSCEGKPDPLSNFYLCRMEDAQGSVFLSGEHQYQYKRVIAVVPEGRQKTNLLRQCKTDREPRDVKAAAKDLTSPEWQAQPLDVVWDILRQKYSQCPKFAYTLGATGQQALVHSTPDPYWGCGPDGMGQNVHGVLLAELREQKRRTLMVSDSHGCTSKGTH
jgi:ribA/ribD-fused uncharacterized protein